MNKNFRLVASMFLILALAACSHDDKKDKPQVPVEQMYLKAQQSLRDKNYLTASKEFDEVEQNYPYSDWAKRAQIMSAYSHYKNLKYDDAITALDRFIQLYPGDEGVDYAYYLKALSYYERISDVGRDQEMTQNALDALKQVVSRFPDSEYARDAKLKIDLTVDHIAGKHMEIGRYYLVRKQYQAAINRFEKVIEQYQTTTHVPEALHRLVECYLSLGILEEAKKDAAILGANYPNTQWYKDSYKLFQKLPEDKKADESFMKKTFGKLL